MLKYFFAAAAAFSITTIGIPATKATAAPLDCKRLNGKWSGNMSGVYRGKTSVSIKNCRLTWKLPDGRTNYCRYREKAGKVQYSCSLGSRGSVAIKGNRITMQNIYTASRHGKYTVKISKLGQ